MVQPLFQSAERLLVLRAGDASARHRRARRKADRQHQAEFGCVLHPVPRFRRLRYFCDRLFRCEQDGREARSPSAEGEGVHGTHRGRWATESDAIAFVPTDFARPRPREPFERSCARRTSVRRMVSNWLRWSTASSARAAKSSLGLSGEAAPEIVCETGAAPRFVGRRFRVVDTQTRSGQDGS